MCVWGGGGTCIIIQIKKESVNVSLHANTYEATICVNALTLTDYRSLYICIELQELIQHLEYVQNYF